jgi:gamma-glutamyltranspeptidase/glutathione hydrolase
MNRLLAPLAALLALTSCAPTAIERAPVAGALGAGARGVVSAADPRAAEAGRSILAAGGSAADAAIATAIALTVVEPQSSGIGGGGFLVYHDVAKGLASYDGREEAPSAARPDLFLDTSGKPRPGGQASIGGQAVGVPGNIRMFAMAHGRHGRLPWARLFEPAIRLARDGFVVTPRMARMVEGRTEAARLTPWGRATFFGTAENAKPAGTVVRNPELARLLEGVAARGADWYYTGPPAQALVRAVTTTRTNPSSMTLGDVATYDAKQREVLCGAYRGHRICGMGPPSSGGTTVFAILKQLERFDLAAMGRDSPEAWHLIAESMRLAYADRNAFIGDPEYTRVPVRGMMDPAYLASRSQLIRRDRALAQVAAGTPPGAPRVTSAVPGELAGTSHMVATDRFGNVASLTSTIEAPWGSGLTVDGYYLNNEMTDFSFVPTQNGAPVANRVEGGKRPLSSMSPTIVYGPDGQVRLAVGAAGGPTIIMQVAKAIIGVVDWRMSAEAAIAAPGMWIRGERIFVEEGTPLAAMVPRLTALGHRVAAAPPPFKGNAIERVGGRWVGAADPRSEGVAVAE